MSISLTRYVDITSSVGASNIVPERQYIARLFTDNILLPPQSFIEFSSSDEVALYFGINSNEFLRAEKYFGFLSKNGTTPQLISYARWVDVAMAPMIFGLSGGQAYTNYTGITTGSLGLTIAGQYFNLSSLNFGSVTSLAQVAGVIETAINAESGGGAMWTAATVVYNPVNGGSFVFTGGVTGAATISVSAGIGGVDISALIGWLPEAKFNQGVFTPGSIVAPGSAIEDPAASFLASSGASNNFGSFAFITATPLTLAQNIEVANANATLNVTYMFQIPVIAANASAWSDNTTGLGEIAGVGLTLNVTPITQSVTLNSTTTVTGFPSTLAITVGMQISGTGIPHSTVVASIVNNTSITISNAATVSTTETVTVYPIQFPEMLPMSIQAATNYNALNSVQNYEFQQIAGLVSTVTTDALADSYDAMKINYYGQTQTAGQLLSFYQTGVLCGLPVDPAYMNIYSNEIWLKDAMSSTAMSLLMGLAAISASNQGVLQLTAVLRSVISQALSNGTISVGKPLSAVQKLYITQITGDATAWQQVQNSGFVLLVAIVPQPNTTPVKYQAVYTLVYSKDDVISKVVGTHNLI